MIKCQPIKPTIRIHSLKNSKAIVFKGSPFNRMTEEYSYFPDRSLTKAPTGMSSFSTLNYYA